MRFAISDGCLRAASTVSKRPESCGASGELIGSVIVRVLVPVGLVFVLVVEGDFCDGPICGAVDGEPDDGRGAGCYCGPIGADRDRVTGHLPFVAPVTGWLKYS